MNKSDVLNALSQNLTWGKGLDGTRYACFSVLGFKIEIFPEAMDENSKPVKYMAGHHTAASKEWTVIARDQKTFEAAKAAVVDWLASQIISLATAPAALPVLQE